MTTRQITASNADEQIKQLYETAFPEGEQIPWEDLLRLIGEMPHQLQQSHRYIGSQSLVTCRSPCVDVLIMIVVVGKRGRQHPSVLPRLVVAGIAVNAVVVLCHSRSHCRLRGLIVQAVILVMPERSRGREVQRLVFG